MSTPMNMAFSAFSYGELSPACSGRFDIDVASKSVGYLDNWSPVAQGPLDFRPGFIAVANTRRNAKGKILRFVYNENKSFGLCITPGYMRFLADGGVLTQTPKTISGATRAASCTVTAVAHGFSNGDEVFISGVRGMTSINNTFYVVANVTANTFELRSALDGTTAIDSSAFGPYLSGGTAAEVYEIPVPYAEVDFDNLRIAVRKNTAYIYDGRNPLRKLKFVDAFNWELTLPQVTADRFAMSISSITAASPAVVTTTAVHSYLPGDLVYLDHVVGSMGTFLNAGWYKIGSLPTTSKLSLQTIDGVDVSTVGLTYTSGGKTYAANDQPACGGFYAGRLLLGGSVLAPDVLYGSRAPEDSGADRFEDFTTGTDASHGLTIVPRSQNNTADEFRFIVGTSKFLAIGSLGGVYQVTGAAGAGTALTPTGLSVSPVDSTGCAPGAIAQFGAEIFYLKAGRQSMASFGYDLNKDSYTATDLNLLNEVILSPGLADITHQKRSTDLVWCRRTDGTAVTLAFKSGECRAWSRATSQLKFLSFASVARPDGADTLWAITEHVAAGVTYRQICRQAENESLDVVKPLGDDPALGKLTREKFLLDKRRLQCFVDSAVSYDGTQSTTLTVSGSTLTAGDAVFPEGCVGQLIGPRFLAGTETGRFRITTRVSATEVIGDVLEPFSQTSWASGTWQLSRSEITALGRFEGLKVRILADGGQHPDAVVSGGKITLNGPYLTVMVGLGFDAWLKTNPFVPSYYGMPLAHFTKTMKQVSFRVRNFGGTLWYGSEDDVLHSAEFSAAQGFNTMPPALQTKELEFPAFDGYSIEKALWIAKRDCLPGSLHAIGVTMEVTGVDDRITGGG